MKVYMDNSDQHFLQIHVSFLPSYSPFVSLQFPEWLLPLLELALQDAPSDRGLRQPPRLALRPDDVEHSGAWLQLAKVAEAEALLSLLGLWECLT